MMRSRFLASNFGSAEMPSSSGISMSSTATSGLIFSSWLTASRPVRREAVTCISGSAPIQREIMPRITTESSTTITRSGSCRIEVGAGLPVNATLITHQRLNGTNTNEIVITSLRFVFRSVLFEHDLFGKLLSTFPRHAVEGFQPLDRT